MEQTSSNSFLFSLFSCHSPFDHESGFSIKKKQKKTSYFQVFHELHPALLFPVVSKLCPTPSHPDSEFNPLCNQNTCIYLNSPEFIQIKKKNQKNLQINVVSIQFDEYMSIIVFCFFLFAVCFFRHHGSKLEVVQCAVILYSTTLHQCSS